MGIFALVTMLTVSMGLRYAVMSRFTYVSMFLFLVVTVGVFVVTGSYLVQVDWSQTVELFGPIMPGL
jgi:hypothetical protein